MGLAHEAKTRKAAHLCSVRPGVEHAVGRRVAGLPRGATEGSQGGEELEHRQGGRGGAGEEVLRAVHLACKVSGEVAGRAGARAFCQV